MLWTKTPDIRWFNGCVQTARIAGRDVGIFNEKYLGHGYRWSVRVRLDGHCWGHAAPFETKRAAVAFAEAHYAGREG